MKRQKWASAEAKRAGMELKKSWNKLQEEYAPKKPIVAKRNLKKPTRLVNNSRIAELRSVPSVDSGVKGAVNMGTETKMYTGDRITGIAVMHKSNLVPIFSAEAAQEVARMRR